MDREPMCVVTLDEVMGCLVRPHTRCVEVGSSPIPVERWVIDQDLHGLPDSPSDAICFPAYDGETVHTDRMFHGLDVLINRGRGSEVFFEPIPKSPSQFPNILLLTFCLDAFVPVY